MEWSYYDSKKLDKQILLNHIRNRWSVEFPKQFIELITNFNNGVPEKNVFDTKRNQRMLGTFLNFDNEVENYNAFKIWEDIKDRLPKLVFPLASDPFGNFTCFDFRNNNRQPEVVFWNHEGYINEESKEKHDIEYVAESFDKFMNKLYKLEDDDDDFDIDDFEVLS